MKALGCSCILARAWRSYALRMKLPCFKCVRTVVRAAILRPVWAIPLGLLTSVAWAQYAPLPVVVTPAKLTQHVQRSSLVGEIVPQFESDVAFQIDGEVIERFVEIGDFVVIGQPLARLNDAQQQAEITAAQALLTSARTQLGQADATLQRQTALLDQGLTTRRQYDDAIEDVARSKSALDGTEADYENTQQAITNTVLRSGAAGVVTSVAVESGQVVPPGAAVFTIATDGPLDAVFEVEEIVLTDEFGKNDIIVQLYDNPGVSAVASLREVSPMVDPTTGAVQVKLALHNPPPQMALGSVVRGTAVHGAVTADVFPATALFSQDGKPAVWVVNPDDETVSLRTIVLDSFESDAIVVTGGLSAGDLVVTRGASLLHPGQSVSIQQVSTP